MKRALLTLATLPLLAACGGTTLGLPTALTTTALGADVLGGLNTSIAAHASVEAAQPNAFVLVTQSASFLQALNTTVEPQRQAIAAAIQADTSVTQTLARWNTVSATTRLTALKQVASLECSALGITAPTLASSSATPPQTGMLALYQPDTTGPGTITLYSSALGSAGAYLALATVVHEVRHAAQYQLVLAYERGGLGLTANQRTLAAAYDQAWQAMDAWGGEASLSYGDYVHLAVEYDAFQTGNEVASLVSGGTYDASGSGFVTTRYLATGKPILDLAPLVASSSGQALVGAVNQAEAKAESAQGGGSSRQQAPQQPYLRHGGPTRGGLASGVLGAGGF